MDNLIQLLFLVSLLALAASLVEGLVLSRIGKKDYDWRATGTSLAITVLRRVTELVPLWVAMPGAFWIHEHRLFNIPMDAAWSWLLLFLGVEFFYYWFHRASHRVRWFWTNHLVHHTPNQFNLSAAYRLGWASRFIGVLGFFLPLVWLGFEPKVVAVAFVLNLLYQFWIHAAWIPRLGWLEGIVNTPSAHRVHHATNLEYLDANYGGVLMVFDRLFGTYVAEREDLPIRYGLVNPVLSYNPFRIVLLPWWELLRDLARCRSLREFAGTLFGPPGWRADGQGMTTENLRQAALQTCAPGLSA